MDLQRRTKRKWFALGLAGWFIAMGAAVLFAAVQPTLAEETGASSPGIAIGKQALKACVGAAPGVSSDPCLGPSEALETADEDMLKPALQFALLSSLLNLVQYVLDRLAYEAAVAIASGGEGQSSLFFTQEPAEAWKSFGLDVAGEAIGSLSELTGSALDIEFDFCAPPDPLIILQLQLGIKQAYQPVAPKCDFNEIVANWEGFISTTIDTVSNPSETVLNAFAEGLRPGKNELSAAIGLNIKVHEQVLLIKNQKLQEQLASGGFKNVTDFITGNVMTPADTLKASFNTQLNEARSKGNEFSMQAAINNSHLIGQMFLSTASTFTNTLLSTLFTRIYTGLFEPEPLPDPFDVETIAIGGRDEAADRFASLLTTSPISISDYNAISEFVACPAGGITTRNVNNCVMDANFAAAVARGEGGVALTVQEAIDDGLLQGGWPLISPSDLARNQDPFCYTYGYCYGNLVKMRKARIISVGWEIAANRNSTSNPATLQEIVDGFDDCNDQGTIDTSTHKWCHLIDPNWVIKYPETQCRAYVNGEVLVSTISGGRAGVCADTPSCVDEDNDGNCTGGYGYCVREKNAWRFRGDECPSYYASCLSFENTFTGEATDLLVNTVDYSICNADNAGCRWYRTQKYYDDAGTADDTSDDTYEWLPTGESFVTADREDDIRYDGSSRETYPYTSDSGESYAYDTYTYEDRVYFNNNIEECSEEVAGCTMVYQVDSTLVLNLVNNPSLEDDADENDEPDNWDLTGATSGYNTTGDAYYGSRSVDMAGSAVTSLRQENIVLTPNSFYTFSLYARGNAVSHEANVVLSFIDEDGNPIDFSGTSYDEEESCVRSGTDSYVLTTEFDEADTWERFECTFTTTDEIPYVTIEIEDGTGTVRVDGIQLEQGSDASAYTEDYNSASPTPSYLVLAPDYLNCTGAETDPPECDGYTQMCTAQDVGCDLWTPEDGDPAVPAIASALDECPTECVGYTTYKQEGTLYDDEEFPLYFIAEGAESCSAEYVGCDSFTNLDALAEGGESIETYTQLRACLTPDDATATGEDYATFYTWEGSDAAGYQLVTWELLVSDLTGTINYSESTGDNDGAPELAPCVNWQVAEEGDGTLTISCVDSGTNDDGDTYESIIEEDDACNEHDDIFEDPDCREFYDAEGNIHYRRFSQTVTISADCHPYRKSTGSETDCESSGGFWTDAGECRYFGLQEESVECPEVAAGCREYTGGAGRNATTAHEDTFEGGDLADYGVSGTASITLSNESVATGGHSMRIVAGASGTVTTYQTYLDWSDKDLTYDSEDPTGTCTGIDADHAEASGGCEIDYGTGNVCVVDSGDNSCGTLDDALAAGKTYVLSFWAKGDGYVGVTFVEEGGSGDSHDFVDPNDGEGDSDTIELDGSWQLYEIGPLDTTDFSDFDDTAVVSFNPESGSTIYIDNLQLKAVEENVTLIKDSWSVPSTCDMSPAGTDAPQYYLGCEAYTNQDGEDGTFYQFSDLCSEDVVGCEAYYDTQNSESPFGAAYNVRCMYDDGDGNYLDGDVALTNTACEMEGEEVCTVSVGRSYCLFDASAALPAPLPAGIVLGPEAVIVSNDTPIFLVNDGSTTCSEESMGCQEIGVPDYTQDREEVVSFESAYYINLPDTYGDILCDNEALFCEEWSSTQDGNFYFKDPGDQTCEYRTNVTLNDVEYYGWFRTDVDQPCYFDDVDGNDAWDADTEDAYLISGAQFGVYRNGDEEEGDVWNEYTGWAAACDSAYDLCTEFIDTVDTSEGAYPQGTSYNFINDELLSEDTLQESQRCNGQVSQKEGCVLFYNTNDSELSYAAGPSYIASVHADDLFGDAPLSLQDPITCPDGGEVTTPSGDTIDLCSMRCRYDLASDDITLEVGNGVEGAGGGTNEFVDACYVDSDCPVLKGSDGEDYEGTCIDVAGSVNEATATFQNDTNEILKVDRDRECAEWLACTSSQVSWNPRTAKYENICSDVGLCSRYSISGDSAGCTQFEESDAIVLDATEYANRDVSWKGLDYSGYAIPEQLPIEHYSQVDISPSAASACVLVGVDTETMTAEDWYLDEEGQIVTCEVTADCGGAHLGCVDVQPDLHLAHFAGPCDEESVGYGGTCTIGFCEETGEGCSTDGDCSTGDCVVGYCQEVSTTPCTEATEATDCSGDTPVCDESQGVCVDAVVPYDGGTTCVVDANCSVGQTCTPAALSKTGACYSNQCLTDIDGSVFSPDSALIAECRGYPEALSPYGSQVVAEWGSRDDEGNLDLNGQEPNTRWSEPYTLQTGWEGATTCAPDTDGVGVNNDCVCSYDRAEYGDGAEVRYYPPGTANPSGTDVEDRDGVLHGICASGEMAGYECINDSECGDNGTCFKLSKKDTLLGWDGYCLEKDTSIQLYASTDPNNRPCLTWLPIDQLAGSTDLYGKYVDAGYNEGVTFYCADIQEGYDLMTSGMACAESYGCAQDHGWSDGTENDFLSSVSASGSCVGSVVCPNGYFAVMTGCGKLSYDEDDAADEKMCPDGIGDDDCPFFCVPKGSYKTDDDDIGSAGDPCLTPEATGHFNEVESWRASSIPDANRGVLLQDGQDFMVYLVYDINDGITFKGDVVNFYDDCAVRGVTNNIDEFIAPYDLESLPTGGQGYSRGFYDLTWTNSIGTYAVCSTIVQVSSNSAFDDGSLNAAWTDRTWGSTSSLYTIQDADSAHFGYGVGLSVGVFGRVDDYVFLNEVDPDPYPIHVISCTSDAGFSPDGVQDSIQSVFSPRADVSCDLEPLYISNTSGIHAWPYLAFTSTLTNEKSEDYPDWSAYCTNADCSCSDDVDCNDGGPTCTAGGECDGGPKDGQTCDDDVDCQVLSCITETTCTGGGFLSNETCFTDQYCGYEGTGFDIVAGDTEDGIARLQQIFARAYDLYQFDDGYDGISDDDGDGEADNIAAEIGLTEEWTDHGEYYDPSEDEEDPDNWAWDVTGTGDGNEDPEPPVVISLGSCVGALCEEGEEGRITVNGIDDGTIEGSGGRAHVSASFFVAADEDQMPIRNILIDWGNGSAGNATDWSTDADQDGSTAPDNYYRNHRGLLPTSDEETYCDDNSIWGKNSQSCDESYRTYTHDYICTQGMVDDLVDTGRTTCDTDGDGFVDVSPCTEGGACVYGIRVLVKDNWGWCTGFCDAGLDNTEGCYEDVSGDPGSVNECDWNNCPGGNACEESATTAIDPWTYYAGRIEVTP